MNIVEAREHREHQCTVESGEVRGTIEDFRHEHSTDPQVCVGGRWRYLAGLKTDCTVVTYYHRPDPTIEVGDTVFVRQASGRERVGQVTKLGEICHAVRMRDSGLITDALVDRIRKA
jgi:hypothetical protein